MSDPVSIAIVSAVVTPLIAVLVLWLRKRLRLVDGPMSDEAAIAVKLTTNATAKPDNRDQALIYIAEKLADQDTEIRELKKRDNAWAMFTWELEHWGLRGWARAPKPHEPMPVRPPRLRPDPPDMPTRSVPE